LTEGQIYISYLVVSGLSTLAAHASMLMVHQLLFYIHRIWSVNTAHASMLNIHLL